MYYDAGVDDKIAEGLGANSVGNNWDSIDFIKNWRNSTSVGGLAVTGNGCGFASVKVSRRVTFFQLNGGNRN